MKAYAQLISELAAEGILIFQFPDKNATVAIAYPTFSARLSRPRYVRAAIAHCSYDDAFSDYVGANEASQRVFNQESVLLRIAGRSLSEIAEALVSTATDQP